MVRSDRGLENLGKVGARPARDEHAPLNTLLEQPAVELLNDERRARGS